MAAESESAPACSHSHEDHPHTHSHENPSQPHSHDDPLLGSDLELPSSDPHTHHLTTSLSSYHLYRRTAHLNLTHARRQHLYSLPLHQRTLLTSPPISLPTTLNLIDSYIASNSLLTEEILRHSIPSFSLPPTLFSHPSFTKLATGQDVDKVRSTLKQFYREWSAEGAGEREIAYGPVLRAIDAEYTSVVKGAVRVLVPGCGLGRLPFELALRGYNAQGNENSFHQLLASNYVLNCAQVVGEHTVYPWIGGWSNHRRREDQLRGVAVPDVVPAIELAKVGASDRFSMAAGDFVEAYGEPESEGTFECVATVFFVDTAWNFVDYVETIRNVLVDGGVWVNFGPLLWHWEGRDVPEGETKGVELTLEECLVVVEKCGFVIEKRETGGKGEYVGSGGRSMLDWVYQGELWVARKVTAQGSKADGSKAEGIKTKDIKVEGIKTKDIKTEETL